MFKYFYRIYDKFDRKVFAIALLTDANKSFRPNVYEYSYFGTKLIYEYNMYKLADQNEVELEQSKNPFSKAVLAGIYMNRTKNDDKRRALFKMKLMREVIKGNGYSRASVSALFYFIDYLLQLPKDLEKELNHTMVPLIQEEASHMIHHNLEDQSPTLAEVLAVVRSEGEKEGKEEGKKEGKREGEKEGGIIKALSIAANLLALGMEPDIVAKVTQLPEEKVRELQNNSKE
ncbi:hypothetical protein [Sporosarcina limicola]|uniref:Transposase n=1 Tax=Sporosarcina limicola TaxID=34101 RepID=A0A927R642_9BACL|nr:hypothetical protein [Sporosarcina limicola]MBE1556773.1 hypothetical protein [Sporosarcina limicola]